MKPLLLSILLASATALAVAAEKDSFSGTWQIQNNIAGNESRQVCTFTQKDSDLTGSCTGERGTVKITGKVDAKEVTWTYKSEYNGEPLTVTHKGTLDATPKISGTVHVPEMGVSGEFIATPSK